MFALASSAAQSMRFCVLSVDFTRSSGDIKSSRVVRVWPPSSTRRRRLRSRRRRRRCCCCCCCCCSCYLRRRRQQQTVTAAVTGGVIGGATRPAAAAAANEAAASACAATAAARAASASARAGAMRYRHGGETNLLVAKVLVELAWDNSNNHTGGNSHGTQGQIWRSTSRRLAKPLS